MRQALRPMLHHSLLFVASITVTTAWLRWTHEQPLEAAGTMSAVSESRQAAVAPLQPRRPATREDPPAAHEVGPPELDIRRARMRELAQVSLASTDAEQVIEAMRGMTEIVTPESLQALSVLAHRPTDARVRLAAIGTLRDLAIAQGDGDGRIRAVLHASTRNAPDAQTLELAGEAAALIESERPAASGVSQPASAAIRSHDQ